MCRRCWLPVIAALTCLIASPAQAQFLSDPGSLRHIHDEQTRWMEDLISSRRDRAFRFLTVADELLALPDKPGSQRTQLLAEAQRLADLVASLDREIVDAASMVRGTRERLIRALESRASSLHQAAGHADPSERRTLETQARELEGELERLRLREREDATAHPLQSAAGTLSALARVVAEEHGHLTIVRATQEELRLFLANLRLFDETSMPPSARSGGGGDHDPGCAPSACSFTGSSPADVPLAHFQPEGPGRGEAATALSPASLARLHEQLTAYVEILELPTRDLSAEDGVVTRETAVGAGLMDFHGDGGGSSVLGPKVGMSLVFSRPLGRSAAITVEPAVGGRALRDDAGVLTEVAGEVREALTGSTLGGHSHWQLVSWQKGRFLSEPLSPPGYLEPGRLEGGLAGRLAVPLHSRWEIEAEGGADGIRYEPEDWRVLDRQGISTALAVAWRGASRSAKLSVRGSHHGFPHPLAEWDERRADTRVGVEVGGSLEGKQVVRLSLGGSWNHSRLAAYDFRSVRTALVLSAPWGKGSLQGYVALAHQVYQNPGPEQARVAPSDQDSGAILSLQYTYPLDATRMLILRGGWSRSQMGFRNDFYERFGIGVHLTFRSR